MSQRHKLRENELGKLHLYQGFMSAQLSRYLAYSALFVTVEAAGVYLAATLKAAGNTDQLLMWIAVGSCCVGFVLLFVFCYFSARNMDRWKDKILELTDGTDIEEDFAHWRRWPYTWYQKTGGKVRLIWMVILFAGLIWVWFCVIL